MHLPTPESHIAFWFLAPIMVITAHSFWDLLPICTISISEPKFVLHTWLDECLTFSSWNALPSGTFSITWEGELVFDEAGVGVDSSSKWSSKSKATEHSRVTLTTWLYYVNPGVRSLAMLNLVAYTVPIVSMMCSIPCETGPVVMVDVAVLLGIFLHMVVALTILPMSIVEAHLLMTMPAIPVIIRGTIVRTVPWWGQGLKLIHKLCKKPG